MTPTTRRAHGTNEVYVNQFTKLTWCKRENTNILCMSKKLHQTLGLCNSADCRYACIHSNEYAAQLMWNSLGRNMHKNITVLIKRRTEKEQAPSIPVLLLSPMAFLSYQPLWSIHCLSSSIGGCAPYTSTAGMLRSSTKKTKFLPRGGPNTPLRL